MDENARIQWLETHIFPCEKEARGWLARHVRSLSAADIDDLIQEVYARLWEADLLEVKQPRSYLFKTLRNLVAEGARRAQIVPMERLGEIDELFIPSEEPGPERRFAARQELQRFLALVESLPAQCRRAYELHRIYGYSQREIAGKMNISPRTVENHLANAQKHITERLTLIDARDQDTLTSELGTHGTRTERS